MLGIGKPRRLEGWAQEITEADAKGDPSGLWQKIGESNKLWLIAFGAIVIASFWMIMDTSSRQQIASLNAEVNRPAATGAQQR